MQTENQPVNQALSKLFLEFFESEKAGGLLLVTCAVISLLISNLDGGDSYINFWHVEFANHSLVHWINDGLMAVFFLLIGLELERELYAGELANRKKAILPMVAAIGGITIPVMIYLLFTSGTDLSNGAGIPMATDIAFAVGIISLLGKGIPSSLKIFLMALAIFDDLGAILVIAVFYSSDISFLYLGSCFLILTGLFILNRLRIHQLLPYLLGGIGMWYSLLHSGVHPSIAGVLLAFVIPFGNGSETTLSYRLQHWLHKPVAFIVLPLFALANTAFTLNVDLLNSLNEVHAIGIIAGLLIGKPLGILLFVYFGVLAGLCSLPAGIKFKHISGIGFLAGIGFTMSIFIALLAFQDPVIIMESKIAIMLASVLAGLIGYVILRNSTFQDVEAQGG